MNFKRPSKIQERALPFLLTNPPRNMIAQSQSGTGKTAAFVLAILSRVNYELHTPQALILAPTRELARQIMGVIQTMGQFTKAESQFAIPTMVTWGETFTAHIVVGTPGTVLDCIRKRWLPVNNIRVFVVDEADTMLDQQGMGDQCVRVKRWAFPLKMSVTYPKLTQSSKPQLYPHHRPSSSLERNFPLHCCCLCRTIRPQGYHTLVRAPRAHSRGHQANVHGLRRRGGQISRSH